MVLIGEGSKEIGGILESMYLRMCENEPLIKRMSVDSAEICECEHFRTIVQWYALIKRVSVFSVESASLIICIRLCENGFSEIVLQSLRRSVSRNIYIWMCENWPASSVCLLFSGNIFVISDLLRTVFSKPMRMDCAWQSFASRDSVLCPSASLFFHWTSSHMLAVSLHVLGISHMYASSLSACHLASHTCILAASFCVLWPHSDTHSTMTEMHLVALCQISTQIRRHPKFKSFGCFVSSRRISGGIALDRIIQSNVACAVHSHRRAHSAHANIVISLNAQHADILLLDQIVTFKWACTGMVILRSLDTKIHMILRSFNLWSRDIQAQASLFRSKKRFPFKMALVRFVTWRLTWKGTSMSKPSLKWGISEQRCCWSIRCLKFDMTSISSFLEESVSWAILRLIDLFPRDWHALACRYRAFLKWEIPQHYCIGSIRQSKNGKRRHGDTNGLFLRRHVDADVCRVSHIEVCGTQASWR